jgi:hypothetical protein
MPTNWVISSGDYMRPYRTQGADAATIDNGPESTAQSFLVGALLERDSQVATSAFRLRQAVVSASTVTSTSICGVAAEGASSVTDATRIFWAISPQQEFMARTRGINIASTHVGLGYGIFFDSTKNVYGVDLANVQSTSVRVVVTGLIDAVGDSGGYVRFKFGQPILSTGGFAFSAQPLKF